jgi:hypothetical protein
MPRRRSFTSQLYRAARISNTISAIASGNPGQARLAGDRDRLLGGGWELAQALSVKDDRMPGFVGRAGPTVYRLTRRDDPELPA